jgi:hypothetical protein
MELGVAMKKEAGHSSLRTTLIGNLQKQGMHIICQGSGQNVVQ